MALVIGEVLDGKYRVGRLIGEGGMGAVYEGEHLLIRRRVAIKALLPNFSGAHDILRRFEREAQAAGRIGNDHILEVLDLGRLRSGAHYIVMEYLDGETLGDRIKARGRLSCGEVAMLAVQVLDGLSAAHAAGIVHRDLKPENIFIVRTKAGRRDFVKLIDFGVSRFVGPAAEQGLRVTRAGVVLGTPVYLAPEQAQGKAEADARTDLYAVGVILYEAVSGRLPFDAESFNQLLFKIALSEATPLHETGPDIDKAFSAIVARAMTKDPAQRFQTADEFAAALQEWLGARPSSSGSLPSVPSSPSLPGDRASSPNDHPTIADAPRSEHDTLAHEPTWAATQAGIHRKPATIIAVVAATAALLAVLIVVALMKRGTTTDASPIAAAASTTRAPETVVPPPPTSASAEPVEAASAPAPALDAGPPAMASVRAPAKPVATGRPHPVSAKPTSTVPDFGY